MYVAKGNRIGLHYAKHHLKALEYVLEKFIVHNLFHKPGMLIGSSSAPHPHTPGYAVSLPTPLPHKQTLKEKEALY